MSEPEIKVDEAPKDLEALEPIVLTGKETPDELKAKLLDIDKQRIEERQAHQKQVVARRQIHARAIKAETDLKAVKPEVKPVVEAPKTDTVDVDERVLVSQGIDPDLLKQLKDIAKLRGVPLIEAQKDPLYVTIKETFDKKNKSDDASLRGGKGSGTKSIDKKDDPSEPGISREEHQRRVKLLQG